MTDQVEQMTKAYNDVGLDWMELTLPPDDPTDEWPRTIRVNLTFMLSNWTCIFGRSCPGTFGAHESMINPDAGCCPGSFYLSGPEDEQHVTEMIEQLTPEDWDDEQRKYVEKNGWLNRINPDLTGDDYQAKGKVHDHACVFLNRSSGSVGSTGKIGCAFHHMGARKGLDHVDVMPEVCWQLPLRYSETDQEGVWELTAWDVSKWNLEMDEFDDRRYHCKWWCVDMPEAYIADNAVWQHMKRELVEMLGEDDYNAIDKAIRLRLNQGNLYPNMPGATVNEGRPLLPLLIGNREARYGATWPGVPEEARK